MAYTAVTTKSTGNTLAAADWNTYLRDNMTAVATPPIGWVHKSTTQSISNATATTVTWPTTNLLTGFTIASNALKPTVAGIYRASTQLEWASNSTSIRLLYIQVNAATQRQHYVAPVNGTETSMLATVMLSLAAADSVTVLAQQNTGGSLNLTANCEFWIEWVSY